MRRLFLVTAFVVLSLFMVQASFGGNYPPCATHWKIDGTNLVPKDSDLGLDIGPFTTPYADTITVATSGGDYTDISEAVAAATAGQTVLVYPGTYTDTITFAANDITVVGMGKANAVILQQADANVVNFNTRTGIQLRNMRIQVTAATGNTVDTITGSTGSLTAKFCDLRLTATAACDVVNLDQPAIVNVTGTGTFTHRIGRFTYIHPGDSAATGIKAAYKATTGGTIRLSGLYSGTITTSDGCLASTVMFDLASTAILEMDHCTIDITDSTAGTDEAVYVIGIGYLGGSATTHEFFYNTVHITGGASSTATYGVYAVGAATTTTSTAFNHIHCTGAAANYGYFVGAGNTLNSHFDDIVAASGNNITGTFTAVNSTADGEFTVTGDITADTITGTITVVESIPISWAEGGTSSPAGLTAKDQIKYRDFDDAADEDLLFEWIVPPDLQEVTANEVKVRVRGLITNATAPAATEGVAFQIGGCSIGDGDLVTCAEGTLVVSEEDDLNGDAGANAQWDAWATGWVVITITNLTAGETVRFSLNRDISDAEDDYEQDIGVSWLEIKYYRQIGSVTY